jgi:NADPH-dependent glutamate synthase beta subunit-like oxidoreductase
MTHQPTPVRGTRLFQINEDDLATLERVCPALVERLYPQMDNDLRVKIRQLQQVITNVRWNYGPPQHVEVIPG